MAITVVLTDCISKEYRRSVRLITLLRLPGGPKESSIPNREVDEFVSLADFAPTFIELAGESAPENLTGASLVPFLNDETPFRLDRRMLHPIQRCRAILQSAHCDHQRVQIRLQRLRLRRGLRSAGRPARAGEPQRSPRLSGGKARSGASDVAVRRTPRTTSSLTRMQRSHSRRGGPPMPSVTKRREDQLHGNP